MKLAIEYLEKTLSQLQANEKLIQERIDTWYHPGEYWEKNLRESLESARKQIDDFEKAIAVLKSIGIVDVALLVQKYESGETP